MQLESQIEILEYDEQSLNYIATFADLNKQNYFFEHVDIFKLQSVKICYDLAVY